MAVAAAARAVYLLSERACEMTRLMDETEQMINTNAAKKHRTHRTHPTLVVGLV